jgi:hypothetical protein
MIHLSGRPRRTVRVSPELRALRWWLRLTGLLALLGGVACIVAEPTWVPALILGIGLVVYGIAALSTEVGPRAVKR